MQKLAPVLITVYDRFDSLQNAISNLQKNELSKQTDLYIVSDYAYDVKHEEIINQIREYIKNIKGFKSVEGIFWDVNKGSFDSWYDATKYIFSKHDRLIIFEDDILVSNRFLEYMNTALDFYKDDKRIISIASHVHYKNIPTCSGLGGGSSNAATYLLAFNEILELSLSSEILNTIASNIGADVSFFIYKYLSANVYGKGEIIKSFDDDNLEFSILTPPLKIQTKEIFDAFKKNFLNSPSFESKKPRKNPYLNLDLPFEKYEAPYIK